MERQCEAQCGAAGMPAKGEPGRGEEVEMRVPGVPQDVVKRGVLLVDVDVGAGVRAIGCWWFWRWRRFGYGRARVKVERRSVRRSVVKRVED